MFSSALFSRVRRAVLSSFLAGSVLALATAFLANAAPPTLKPVSEQYTKYEFRIPMRDGVKLFTAVYVPKDAGDIAYPILLNRTPYSVAPYGPEKFRERLGPNEWTQSKGYIFVYQDVRGRYESEGSFVHIRPYIPNKPKGAVDETTDTYDTIDWLLKNLRGHNGKVGMYGISYPGFYSSMGLIDAHPALKAVSPQAPVGDWFVGDDWGHNGTFYLTHAVRWLWMNSRDDAEVYKRPRANPVYPTPDSYRLFLELGTLEEINERFLQNKVSYWTELMSHRTYDAYWKEREVTQHLRNVKPAVLTVGGWFDAEDLYGTLQTYRKAEAMNPGLANTLVMGPWSHGQWFSGKGDRLGDVHFHVPAGEWYREQVEYPFFEKYLRDGNQAAPAEAVVFETGTNQWRTFGQWPPAAAQEKQLHLSGAGRLAWNPPARGGFQEWISDPAKPVPYVGYITNVMTVEHMLDDQRFAATRPDVVVFQTDPLEEDLTLAGPIEAQLQFSSSGTDSDVIVKLIDVYPDDFPDPQPNPKNLKMGGYQQLVRGEPFRAKFRKGFDRPLPLQPNQQEAIRYELPDVFHTFRRGHRVMVQIQSSWFPLVDRNPQQFLDIAKAKPADFKPATQRIYFGAVGGSSLKVRVLPAGGR